MKSKKSSRTWPLPSGVSPRIICLLTGLSAASGFSLVLTLAEAVGETSQGKPATGQTSADSPSTVRHVLSHDRFIESDKPYPPPGDCNANGIPDSADIANRMEDDVNHNAIADCCDPDDAVRSSNNRFEGDWQDVHKIPRASYYRVRLDPFGVCIRYTVPPGGARVSLSVLDPRNHVVTVLHAARDTSGAYEINWFKTVRDSDDRIAPGLYTFRLRVGAQTYSQQQRWLY